MINISTLSIQLLIIAIIVTLILIFIFTTGKFERPEVVKSSYALGTIINLKVLGSKGEKAIEEGRVYTAEEVYQSAVKAALKVAEAMKKSA